MLAQELTDKDVAKLEVFLRLGEERLGCDWKIVYSGEAHVLVYGGDEPCTLQGVPDDPLEVRRISDPGRDHPAAHHGMRVAVSTLVRPLQYDVVIDTLLDAERKFARPVFAPARAPALGPAAALAPAPLLARAPVPALAHSAVPVAAPLQPGARYRLRRWPAAEWVQRSRAHLRLASFLSTRHVDVVELVRLANVGVPQCEEALATLIAAGALDVKPPRSIAPRVVAAPARSRPSPPPGLLSLIRRRLGLGAAP
ncbi:MAG TPA: hypothetical protein VGM74_18810 [Burkholderiaceae bacterium]